MEVPGMEAKRTSNKVMIWTRKPLTLTLTLTLTSHKDNDMDPQWDEELLTEVIWPTYEVNLTLTLTPTLNLTLTLNL